MPAEAGIHVSSDARCAYEGRIGLHHDQGAQGLEACGSSIALSKPSRAGPISSRRSTLEATDMDASLRWHDGGHGVRHGFRRTANLASCLSRAQEQEWNIGVLTPGVTGSRVMPLVQRVPHDPKAIDIAAIQRREQLKIWYRKHAGEAAAPQRSWWTRLLKH